MIQLVSAGENPRITVSYDPFVEDLIARGVLGRPSLDTEAVEANIHILSEGMSTRLPDVAITFGEITQDDHNLAGSSFDEHHYTFGLAEYEEGEEVRVTVGVARRLGDAVVSELLRDELGEDAASGIIVDNCDGFGLCSEKQMEDVLLHELKHAADFYNPRIMAQHTRYVKYCQNLVQRVENTAAVIATSGVLVSLLGMDAYDNQTALVAAAGVVGTAYAGHRGKRWARLEVAHRLRTWHQLSPLERAAYAIDTNSEIFQSMITGGPERPRNYIVHRVSKPETDT